MYLAGPDAKLSLGLTAAGLVGMLASYVSNREERQRTQRILDKLQWAHERDEASVKRVAEERK